MLESRGPKYLDLGLGGTPKPDLAQPSKVYYTIRIRNTRIYYTTRIYCGAYTRILAALRVRARHILMQWVARVSKNVDFNRTQGMRWPWCAYRPACTIQRLPYKLQRLRGRPCGSIRVSSLYSPKAAELVRCSQPAVNPNHSPLGDTDGR
jgi:hypothetical protein